ncbi:hypothetical protein K502DRAFT_365589 [Neoconidiobolus thromboides FSU 785]|nr:hypothetical protein K502DRAFT_365589 [Neoconidiobolus thromboides FSU 785]
MKINYNLLLLTLLVITCLSMELVSSLPAKERENDSEVTSAKPKKSSGVINLIFSALYQVPLFSRFIKATYSIFAIGKLLFYSKLLFLHELWPLEIEYYILRLNLKMTKSNVLNNKPL